MFNRVRPIAHRHFLMVHVSSAHSHCHSCPSPVASLSLFGRARRSHRTISKSSFLACTLEIRVSCFAQNRRLLSRREIWFSSSAPKRRFLSRPEIQFLSSSQNRRRRLKSDFSRQPKIAVCSPNSKSDFSRLYKIVVFSPDSKSDFSRLCKIVVFSANSKSDFSRLYKIGVFSTSLATQNPISVIFTKSLSSPLFTPPRTPPKGRR